MGVEDVRRPVLLLGGAPPICKLPLLAAMANLRPSSCILQSLRRQLTDLSSVFGCEAAEILEAAFECHGQYADLRVGLSQEFRRMLKADAAREPAG